MTIKSVEIGKLVPQKRDAQNDISIERGDYKPDTKPSTLFKGVWKKNNNRLSANEIREQAWGPKK